MLFITTQLLAVLQLISIFAAGDNNKSMNKKLDQNSTALCLHCEKKRKVVVTNPKSILNNDQSRFNLSAEKCFYFDQFKPKQRHREATEGGLLPDFKNLFEWFSKLFEDSFAALKPIESCINCKRKIIPLRNDHHLQGSDFLIYVQENVFLIDPYANKCRNLIYSLKRTRKYKLMLKNNETNLTKDPVESENASESISYEAVTPKSVIDEVQVESESLNQKRQLASQSTNTGVSHKKYCTVPYLKNVKFVCKIKESQSYDISNSQRTSTWCTDKSKDHCIFFQHVLTSKRSECPNTEFIAKKIYLKTTGNQTPENSVSLDFELKKPENVIWFRILDNGNNSFVSPLVFRLKCRWKGGLLKKEFQKSTLLPEKQVQKDFRLPRYFDQFERANVCEIKVPLRDPVCEVIRVLVKPDNKKIEHRVNLEKTQIVENITSINKSFDPLILIFPGKCPVELPGTNVRKLQSGLKLEVTEEDLTSPKQMSTFETFSLSEDSDKTHFTETRVTASEVVQTDLPSSINENRIQGRSEVMELLDSVSQENLIRVLPSAITESPSIREFGNAKSTVGETYPSRSAELKLSVDVYTKDELESKMIIQSVQKEDLTKDTDEARSTIEAVVPVDIVVGSVTLSADIFDSMSSHEAEVNLSSVEAEKLGKSDEVKSVTSLEIESELWKDDKRGSLFSESKEQLPSSTEELVVTQVMTEATPAVTSGKSGLEESITESKNTREGVVGKADQLVKEEESIDEKDTVLKQVQMSVDESVEEMTSDLKHSVSSDKIQFTEMLFTETEEAQTVNSRSEEIDEPMTFTVTAEASLQGDRKVPGHTQLLTMDSDVMLRSTADAMPSKIDVDMPMGKGTRDEERILAPPLEIDREGAVNLEPSLPADESGDAAEPITDTKTSYVTDTKKTLIQTPYPKVVEKILATQVLGPEKVTPSQSDGSSVVVQDASPTRASSVIPEAAGDQTERKDTAALRPAAEVANQAEKGKAQPISTKETRPNDGRKALEYEDRLRASTASSTNDATSSTNDAQHLGSTVDSMKSAEVVLAPFEPTKSVSFATEDVVKTTEWKTLSMEIKETVVGQPIPALVGNQLKNNAKAFSKTKRTEDATQDTPSSHSETNTTKTKFIPRRDVLDEIRTVSAMKVVERKADDLPLHAQRKTTVMQGGQKNNAARGDGISFRKIPDAGSRVSDENLPRSDGRGIAHATSSNDAKEEGGHALPVSPDFILLSLLAVVICYKLLRKQFGSFIPSQPRGHTQSGNNQQPPDDGANVEELPESNAEGSTGTPRGKTLRLETVVITADIFFIGDGVMDYQVKRSWHG